MISSTKEEFENILGMKIEDEIFFYLYIHARYLPGYKVFPIKLIPLFLKSKFRLPLATNFLFKKFSRRIINNDTYQDIVNKISDQGYYVVKNFLNSEQVDKIKNELEAFGYSTGGDYSSPSGQTHKVRDLRANDKVIDQDAPSVFFTHGGKSEINAHSEIGRLMIDPYMADISASYFQCRPYLTRVTGIFTRARDPKVFTDTHAFASAQAWHFDYSDFKFLKFFIYLTDVTPENGPHTFAAATHDERLVFPTSPDDFYKNGFRRYTNGEIDGRIKDEWVNKNIDRKRIIEFAAPKGTLIIENTSGLHKGGNCVTGSREVLVYDYAISNNNSPYGLPTLDYSVDFPYDSHLMTVLKSLKQDQIEKANAFKKEFTIKQRIRGKFITTFNIKGVTLD
jgi:hypothetical protein